MTISTLTTTFTGAKRRARLAPSLNSRRRLSLSLVVAMFCVLPVLTGCTTFNEPAPHAGVAQSRHYATKTLYAPQQAALTYAPAPAGYLPVFTQLVARHGARGLSSPGSDLVAYNLFLDAQAHGQLTPLGHRFGPDVMRMLRANALLGYSPANAGASVSVSAREPGYGNLSRRGVLEHQGLATRMAARLAELFNPPPNADANTNVTNTPPAARQVIVQTSGVDRARDSATNFVDALVAATPRGNLAVHTEATAGPATPIFAAGTNRFLLYFHRLNTQQDQLFGPEDPRQVTLQQSLAYQKYVSDAALRSRIDAYKREPHVA